MIIASNVLLTTPKGRLYIRSRRDYYVRFAVERKLSLLKLIEVASKRPELALFSFDIFSGRKYQKERKRT